MATLHYQRAAPTDVSAVAHLPRDGEAGGADEDRMSRYLAGEHHPQQALPPRAMWIVTDGASPIGYIAGFPPDVQNVLRRIRTTIRQAEPELEEAIKYEMPTFTLNGNVVFFAAFKEHVSVYPAPRGNKQFKAELARYDGGKGTARFPLDEPIPFDLIARITKFRAEEDRTRAKAKSTRRAKR